MNKLKNPLALFFLTIVSLSVVYGNPQATATLRYQSLTIEQSIPSLPGKLALNKTQKENIVSINQELSQKIRRILTPEQLQNFTATISQGLGLKFALQDLSLTSEQSKQLRQALKSAQTKIQQVLTPEQLDYIQKQQQQRRNRQQQINSRLTAFLLKTKD